MKKSKVKRAFALLMGIGIVVFIVINILKGNLVN